MTQHQEIVDFISEIRNSHSLMTDIFLYGSCMNFYCILQRIYPEAIAYYDCNHIITRIGQKYYDITGEVKLGGHLPLATMYNEKRISKAFIQMYTAELPASID